MVSLSGVLMGMGCALAATGSIAAVVRGGPRFVPEGWRRWWDEQLHPLRREGWGGPIAWLVMHTLLCEAVATPTGFGRHDLYLGAVIVVGLAVFVARRPRIARLLGTHGLACEYLRRSWPLAAVFLVYWVMWCVVEAASIPGMTEM